MFFHRTGKVHVAGVREQAYPYPGTDVIDKYIWAEGVQWFLMVTANISKIIPISFSPIGLLKKLFKNTPLDDGYGMCKPTPVSFKR